MKKSLLIHTVLQNAFVALTEDDKIISLLENDNQKEHGSFLHESIQTILKQNHLTPEELDFIAVTNGPGSYTGIRVGLSAAKGMAYALKKPVVVFSTLELLAGTGVRLLKERASYISMIHARQEEYYIGIYDEKLKEVIPEGLFNLNNNLKELAEKKYFFGPGIDKDLFKNRDYHWANVQEIDPEVMAYYAFERANMNNFSDAEFVVPNYLKEAYTTQPRKIEGTF